MNKLYKQHSITTKAYNWFSDRYTLFKELLPASAPSFDHCVGTKRLLGTLYGIFLRDWSTINDSSFWLKITELWICLRTEIVLYDFTKDSRLGAQEISNTEKARNDVIKIARGKAKEILGSSNESERFISNSIEVIHNAYDKLAKGAHPSFDLITAKCNHIRLPIIIVARFDSKFPAIPINKAISEYLFSLQYLDDYYDMREDFTGVTNHNLFVWKLSRNLFNTMYSERLKLLPFVARYISLNIHSLLKSAQTINSKDKLFVKLLKASMEFLAKWSKNSTNNIPNSLWCDSLNFHDYVPPQIQYEKLMYILSMLDKKVKVVSGEGFCAETIHSLSESCATKVLQKRL